MRLVKIDSVQQAEEEMRKVKSDGIEKMATKAVFRVVKIDRLHQSHANTIKKEMLNVGGDAAISLDAWNKKDCATDVLLFGTLKQFEDLMPGLEKNGLFPIGKQIKNLIIY